MTSKPRTIAQEDKATLLALSFDEMTVLLRGWGEPRFRGEQLWQGLYRQLAAGPEEMTTLPRHLRQRLVEEADWSPLEALRDESTDDGLTNKTLFRSADGQTFETVLMRYPDRNTVCASSQVGCAIGCPFCATGQAGWVRNLSTAEITAQILAAARRLAHEGRPLTNVVFMGMGEPLLNYEAVWGAIRNLNDERGLGLGMRRFTISTAGIVPGIERLTAEGTGVGLAISLHAADNALRDRLVPINRRYPLEGLLEAVARYAEHSGRRPTYEYALIDGVNDSDAHAQRLVERLRGTLCHVNLIPLNATGDAALRPSPAARVQRFRAILQRGAIEATVRVSRGAEIRAGCGQLRGRAAAPQNGER